MSRLLPLLFCVLSATAFSQANLSIPSVQQRTATIEKTAKWVGTTERTFDASQKNPFSMKGFESLVVAAQANPAQDNNPVTDHDLLAVLADKVDARGRFVMNGEVMLLVSGKKLRVGSKVPVTHEGLVYELEISAIDIAKFTVRYRTEEFTRPITKSQTKKP